MREKKINKKRNQTKTQEYMCHEQNRGSTLVYIICIFMGWMLKQYFLRRNLRNIYTWNDVKG